MAPITFLLELEIRCLGRGQIQKQEKDQLGVHTSYHLCLSYWRNQITPTNHSSVRQPRPHGDKSCVVDLQPSYTEAKTGSQHRRLYKGRAGSRSEVLTVGRPDSLGSLDSKRAEVYTHECTHTTEKETP